MFSLPFFEANRTLLKNSNFFQMCCLNSKSCHKATLPKKKKNEAKFF